MVRFLSVAAMNKELKMAKIEFIAVDMDNHKKIIKNVKREKVCLCVEEQKHVLYKYECNACIVVNDAQPEYYYLTIKC